MPDKDGKKLRKELKKTAEKIRPKGDGLKKIQDRTKGKGKT